MKQYLFPILVIILYTIPLYDTHSQGSGNDKSLYDSLYQALEWRNIGPFRGGRAVAVAGIPDKPNTFYMGSTGGGVWKTTDGGISWQNISDNFFKTGSVGAIGIAPSDPNVIYVGMGEHPVRGVMTTHGDGIYKSTNGGKTWMQSGLKDTRHIANVMVHPTNPDVVYVAAQGALYNTSQDKGIYRSVDGGNTWEQILFIDEKTGASGLTIDPNNPRIMYAAMWEHQRYPWTIKSGGPGSGIHKSTDGGDTWTRLTEGLPEIMGKVGISVSPANAERVFAIIEAADGEGGVYRSDNGGEEWQHINKDRVNIARAWYYMEIFADPVDENTVYVLNSPMMKSIDGGKSFISIPIPHVDTHDLWINADDPDIMINANDGGATVTFNGGRTWSTQKNQPTAQFYRVTADNRFPYYLYGGQQDNSAIAIASRNNEAGIGWKDWYSVAGGESAYLAFDPDNPDMVYGTSIQGFITRFNTKTNENKPINAYPEFGLGTNPRDVRYRFNWNAPLVWSPQDPKVMYYGSNILLKTSDGGVSWDEISPDLTKGDTTYLVDGGGPFTNEAAGGEVYGTIMCIEPSQHEKDVIWVGSDDGLVHITKDGGENWELVAPKGLQESIINTIDVSPHDPATAYLVAMRYKFGDNAPYIYKTENYGQSWRKITNGIEAGAIMRVVREDPQTGGLLYAGSEHGLYISFNGGQQWVPWQLNMPRVTITDLMVHKNDLLAATAGRGFWILDDLSAIQQSEGRFNTEQSKLFAPKPTVRFEGVTFDGIDPGNVGKNPPNGVVLDYFLTEEMDSMEVRLEIMDGSGMVIRSYTNQKDESYKPLPGGPPPKEVIPSKQGLNRFAWNFRNETLPGIAKVFIFGDYQGYRVSPGQYMARLSTENDTSTVEFMVTIDPRLNVEPSGFDEQQELLAKTYRATRKINESVTYMRKVKSQIEDWNKHLFENESLDTLVNLGESIIEKIDAWEKGLISPKQETFQDVVNYENKLSSNFMFLKGYLDSHDPTVTAGARERLNDLMEIWDGHRSTMESIKADELKAYNDLFKVKDVPALITDIE